MESLSNLLAVLADFTYFFNSGGCALPLIIASLASLSQTKLQKRPYFVVCNYHTLYTHVLSAHAHFFVYFEYEEGDWVIMSVVLGGNYPSTKATEENRVKGIKSSKSSISHKNVQQGKKCVW